MTRADLVDACLVNPKDTGPKLILADWYEEHEQFERAVYIRTCVEIAKLGDLDTPGSAWRDSEQLLQDWVKQVGHKGWHGLVTGKFKRRWLQADLGTWHSSYNLRGSTWSCGLLTGIALNYSQGLTPQFAKKLIATNPIDSVSIYDQSPLRVSDDTWFWRVDQGRGNSRTSRYNTIPAKVANFISYGRMEGTRLVMHGTGFDEAITELGHACLRYINSFRSPEWRAAYADSRTVRPVGSR